MTAYMIVRARLNESGRASAAANPELLERIESGSHAINSIRLMINPSEPDNQRLVEILESALHCLQSEPKQSEVERQLPEYISEIILQSEAILKREWVRVKQGT